ncbi:MAG: DUF86 domain-containing protein [Elusimicrobia bacterium]|nr:DUF86 domain-containing protein [Elusimicrobiota bacterium]
MRDQALYVKDIIEAMAAIEKFVEGMAYSEFEKDDKTASAVIRKFEIIGEATKNLPDEIKQKYPSIPWKEMAGMRDKLIHFYFDVKHDLIWHTIKDVIPILNPLLENCLVDLGKNI